MDPPDLRVFRVAWNLKELNLLKSTEERVQRKQEFRIGHLQKQFITLGQLHFLPFLGDSTDIEIRIWFRFSALTDEVL
jgi:hypothetical protein